MHIDWIDSKSQKNVKYNRISLKKKNDLTNENCIFGRGNSKSHKCHPSINTILLLICV